MFELLLVLVVAGVLLWALPQLPLDPTIQTVIRVVIIVFVVIWVAYFLLGMMPGLANWPAGRFGRSPCP